MTLALSARLKRFNYRVARRLVRLLVRPTVSGTPPDANGEVVYVLPHRSLADVLLLDLVAESSALPSPTEPSAALDERRRFFFLNRPAGWRRRQTMRRMSERMRRLDARLREPKAPRTSLAPVSVFWGRAADKERSWLRSLVSESWGPSSRLRRLLSLAFNRKDVLLHFHDPLPWNDMASSAPEPELGRRRTARLLRVAFRNQRQAALGPDLSHRRTLIDRIVGSARVRRAIEAGAAARSPDELERQARKAALAMVANMSFGAIRLMDRLLTWFWSRIYDGVAVHGMERVSRLAESHTLVFAPCHRSHIDYLLMSYVLHHRGLMIPHIAAGENLDLPLVGNLLRRAGAFFIRRSFRGDEVYTAVLDEYLYQVLRRGHSVEYFIEGTRSRTGRLLPPRTGLLETTLDAVRRGLPRPVAVVPVHIGYEKVIEGADFTAELWGARKRPESVGGVARAIRLARQSFGSASLAFAPPIDPAEYLERPRASRLLGGEVLRRINRSATLNASSLVALVTLAMPRHAMDEATLATQIDVYRELLERESDHHDHAIDWRPAHRLIAEVERLGLVQREGGAAREIVSHSADVAVSMTWHRNNALHALAVPALIACLVVNRRDAIRPGAVLRRFRTIAPLVAIELHTTLSGAACRRCLRHLRVMGLLEATPAGVQAPHGNFDRRFRTELLARVMMPTLERYFIVAVLLTHAGSGVLTLDDLLGRCESVSLRISRLYEINAPEFHDSRLFRGLLDGLVELGLARVGGDGLVTFDDSAGGFLARSVEEAAEVIPAQIRYAVQRLPAVSPPR